MRDEKVYNAQKKFTTTVDFNNWIFPNIIFLSLFLTLVENNMGQLLSVCAGGDESTKAGALSTPNQTNNNNNQYQSSPHGSRRVSNNPMDGSGTPSSLHTSSSSPYDPANVNHNLHHHHPNNINISSSSGQDQAEVQKQQEEQERQRKQQQEQQAMILKEQARLEHIVSTAGRTMLAIRRRDGYYDPGYAAAQMAELREIPTHHPSRSGDGNGGGGDGNAGNSAAKAAMLGHTPTSKLTNEGSIMEMFLSSSNDAIQYPHHSHHHHHHHQVQVNQVANFFLEDCTEAFLSTLCPTKERMFQGLESVVENLL